MIEMNCRETVDALMDYLDHLLPAGSRAALEGHLAICPRCVEFLSAYRSVSQIARRATELEFPAAAAARLRARIGAELGGS